MIIFNPAGIAMAAAAFGIAFGVGQVAGISAEGPLMTIAGPLCAVFDLAYRYNFAERNWFRASAGGSLFFLPLWQMGFIWLVLGIVYTMEGGG